VDAFSRSARLEHGIVGKQRHARLLVQVVSLEVLALGHTARQDGRFGAFAPLSWCVESGMSLEGIPLRLWRVLLPSRAARAVHKHCPVSYLASLLAASVFSSVLILLRLAVLYSHPVHGCARAGLLSGAVLPVAHLGRRASDASDSCR